MRMLPIFWHFFLLEICISVTVCLQRKRARDWDILEFSCQNTERIITTRWYNLSTGEWVFVHCDRVSVWQVHCAGLTSCSSNVKGSPSSNTIVEWGHFCERCCKIQCWIFSSFCPGLPIFWALKERGLHIIATPPCGLPVMKEVLWDTMQWLFGFLHLVFLPDPFVASYPGLVAVSYWQRDLNQADYRGGLNLNPYSKITKMCDPQCYLGHSNKEKRSFRGIAWSSGDKLFLTEII